MPRLRDIAGENRARDARYREQGWSGYGQYRYWSVRLKANDQALVRQLAEQIGGAVEPERAGSLMSKKANGIVNAYPPPYRQWDWRVRLLVAAGRIGKKRERKAAA